MKNIFLILGYGIPKNILKDESYGFYLKTVLNKIYSVVIKNKKTKPLIIFCGGKTGMFKPYEKNEADEMAKFFSAAIKRKSFPESITKNWTFISEKRSLSTLENLLNSKKIILKQKAKKADIFIFCEQTREKRIKIIARKIFNKNYSLQVLPVDFDMSANRYLPPEFIDKKENLELEHSLWALEKLENLEKHRKVFEEKIKYLRKQGPKAHTEAVKKWWDKKLKKLSFARIGL